jgi:iron complex outermembrane receptor protein
MKALSIFISCIIFSAYSYGQLDSAIGLSEFTVTGISDGSPKLTSLNIESYRLEKLQASGPYNLSDALSRLPGVSQMNTGIAISKPVVRGLYGNRLLVLLSGLRFDNQQWQDEHGLGLSQIGLERIELIRGPASLLYGTDAIGGVINVIEETPTHEGLFTDINTRLYSNTVGTLTDIGIASLRGTRWWRIRGGFESHGDYYDGSNTRILNSRNQGYYVKAGFGFERGRWIQNNTYNFSFNQFGFIMDNLQYFEEDSKWSRVMAGPHHNVMFNVFSSQNTFRLASSILKVNAGVQSNKRAEDEGGGAISLDMHLISILENAKWEKPLSQAVFFIVNQQLTFENNTNMGHRVLIPDAHMLEGNLSAFIRRVKKQLVVEAGIGYSFKQIKTLRTDYFAAEPFTVFRPAMNAMAGLSYNPGRWANFKANIATGYRSPNLAELSSDGIHEGTLRYDRGDKDLKAEQNINVDILAEVAGRSWNATVSAWYNHFNNFIYQIPTGDSFSFLYPIYQFVQHDAHLYGAEGSIKYTPGFIAHISLQEVFSISRGVLDEGGYLPFIPPYKSVTSIRFEKAVSGSAISRFYIEPEAEYAFKQSHPALFETATPGYTLVNLKSGLACMVRGSGLNLGLSIRNLTNVNYYDHLSRLKDFGFHNQGTNFILTLSYIPKGHLRSDVDKEEK